MAERALIHPAPSADREPGAGGRGRGAASQIIDLDPYPDWKNPWPWASESNAAGYDQTAL